MWQKNQMKQEESMRVKFAIGILLFSSCVLIASCDRGKKPYEEAEVLFSQSNYSAAKSKAVEIVQNAPKSKYAPMAKAMVEKIDKCDSVMVIFRARQQAFGTKQTDANIEYEGLLRYKYIKEKNELFRFEGGSECLRARMKAYFVELETALDEFAAFAAKAERKTQNINVYYQYNAALQNFIANYGNPARWLNQSCRREKGADLLRECKDEEVFKNNEKLINT